MSAPLFLGLDSSTQALKASLLSVNLDVISEAEVRFDRDLPHLKTRGGVLFGPEGSGEVFSPVMQIVEALDMLCEVMKRKRWNLSEIRGIAAAGQQHASVYWSHEAPNILSNLDPTKTLTSQLPKAFSRSIIPNWQDSSTLPECEALTISAGGPAALAQLTGSSAHTRFTASQILKFRTTDPQGYANTHRISLVSSAITTLVCADGEVKGIDESDACGMNLWDMSQEGRGWNKVLCSVVGGGGPGQGEELERKLGKVETDGGRVVGRIGDWFVERYGFSKECLVFPGTGDNPATFLSLVLKESEGLVSLGTSDVVLVSTTAYSPHPEYHAFFHPAQIAPPSSQESEELGKRQHEGLRYFNMLVYKNGSLAREHVRDLYFEKSWDKFNAAVERLRPKSATDLPTSAAFWWLLPDIIPAGAHGIFKYICSRPRDAGSAERVESFPDIDTEAIAILESQLLNYRSRSSAILRRDLTDLPELIPGSPLTISPEARSLLDPNISTPSAPVLTRRETAPGAPVPHLSRVYATGGAAANKTILSLMADVLGCPVSKNVEFDPETEEWGDAKWNACSVGVGYKARWGWERAEAAKNKTSLSLVDENGVKRVEAIEKETREKGREWIQFDQVIKECREARARRRMGKIVEGEVEGVRNVGVPGPGSGAYEKVIEWWRALEARALIEGKQM